MDVSNVAIPLDPAAGGRGPDVTEGSPRANARMVGSAGPSRELAQALAAELGDGPVSPTSELRLRVDEELEQVIATVVDTETGDVIKAYPPEAVLSAAKKLKAMLGQMLDRNV